MPVHREVVNGLLLDSIAYNFTPPSSVSMRCQVTELPLVVASYFARISSPNRAMQNTSVSRRAMARIVEGAFGGTLKDIECELRSKRSPD
eukprot:COSAG02_NODE_39_length_48074_cov_106.508890_28_plen_90_part_00